MKYKLYYDDGYCLTAKFKNQNQNVTYYWNLGTDVPPPLPQTADFILKDLFLILIHQDWTHIITLCWDTHSYSQRQWR